jgi:hypothetical protein
LKEIETRGYAQVIFTLKPPPELGIFSTGADFVATKQIESLTARLRQLNDKTSFLRSSIRMFEHIGWGMAQINREDLSFLRGAPEIKSFSLDVIGKFSDVEASQVSQITALAQGSPSITGAGINVAVIDGNLRDDHPALVQPVGATSGIVQEYCLQEASAKSALNRCTRGTPHPLDTSIKVGDGRSRVASDDTDATWPHATGVVGLLVSKGATGLPTATPPLLANLPPSQTQAIKVHAFRVTGSLDPGSPTLGLMNEALAFVVKYNAAALAANKIRIINISLGFPPNREDLINYSYAHCDSPQNGEAFKTDPYQTTYNIIRTLRRQGVIVVAASGNNFGNDTNNGLIYYGSPGMQFPACLSSVVSVSASWDSASAPVYSFPYAGASLPVTCSAAVDRNACYAQRSWMTKIAAPGSYISSPWLVSLSSPAVFTSSNNYLNNINQNEIGRASHGTSFASPLVAACLAQILQAEPLINTEDLIAILSGNYAAANLPRTSAATASSANPAHFLQAQDTVGAQVDDPYTTPLLRCRDLLIRVRGGSIQNVGAIAPSGLRMDGRFGLSGNWYDPSFPGQGFVIEVNSVQNFVFGGWYTFGPTSQTTAAGQRWYTILSSTPPDANTRLFPVGIYVTNAANLGFGVGPLLPNVANSTLVGTGFLRFKSCSAAEFYGTITPIGGNLTSFNMNLERLAGVQRCANDDVAQSNINLLRWRGGSNALPYGELGMRQYAFSGNWTIPVTDAFQGFFGDADISGSYPFFGWYTYTPRTNQLATALPNPPQHRWFSLVREADRCDNTTCPVNGNVVVDQDNYRPLTRKRMSFSIFRSSGGVFLSNAAASAVRVGYAKITPVYGTNSQMLCDKVNFEYQFAISDPPYPNNYTPPVGPTPLVWGMSTALGNYTVDPEFNGLAGSMVIDRVLAIPSFCHPGFNP